VADVLRHQQKVVPGHITRVVESGEDLSEGGPNDNRAAWRAVEVTITPHQRRNVPRIIDFPPINIDVWLPPRFSIAVTRSFSLGPLTSLTFLIRDARHHTEGRFRADLLGLSINPVNVGSRGQWSDIPNDHQITELHDFHHARVAMAALSAQRRGLGGRQVGISAAVLEIRPRNLSARAIRISDFDTGASFLPDAGACGGDLTHFPSVEVPIGTFRD
jgi:hypothetical protein